MVRNITACVAVVVVAALVGASGPPPCGTFIDTDGPYDYIIGDYNGITVCTLLGLGDKKLLEYYTNHYTGGLTHNPCTITTEPGCTSNLNITCPLDTCVP